MLIEKRQYLKNKWNQPLPLDLDSDQTLIFMFYDPQLDISKAVQEVVAGYPLAQIVGCSSAGEIYDTMVYDQSISCVIIKFEHTKIKVVSQMMTELKSSDQVGQNLASELYDPNLKGIFILSDGLNVNGTDLTKGVHQVLSSKAQEISVSGGLSADGSRFQATTTLLKDSVISQRVIGIGFYGDKIKIGTGFYGGWDKFGPLRQVTKSTGNQLFTIDGEPALALYKTYLGEEAKNLPASALLFPLLLQQAGKVDLVRTILSVDEQNQSLTFAGDIPQGAKVQLMRANFSRLIEGASQAGHSSMQKMQEGNQSTLALAVSCVGRRLVMGQKTDDELEALKNKLPANSNLTGFYSYGELSANGVATCELHNQTMTVTVIQEDL